MTQRRNSKIVDYTSTQPRIPIYYEDDYLIIIDKPADLLSQPDYTGDPSILDLIKQHRNERGDSSNNVHLLHRLDRPVSGLMVLAKRKDAAKNLTRQFKEHRVRKSYWVVCHGELPRTGVLQHWLQKKEQPVFVKVHDQDQPKAKKAILSYRTLETKQDAGETFTLAEIHLQTGRAHQIRAQLSHIGHPIVGDVKYGSNQSNMPIHLRSVMLEFEHPHSNEILKFEAYPSTNEQWALFNLVD